MDDQKHVEEAKSENLQPAEAAVEARRAAARRRFLKQGATAGSGLVIYTIYHNRSFAGTKKIMVSSAEACTSMHGTAGKKKKAVSSITGKKVTVVPCEVLK
jgi:hypothetical protein